jgi:hypothetical protein
MARKGAAKTSRKGAAKKAAARKGGARKGGARKSTARKAAPRKAARRTTRRSAPRVMAVTEDVMMTPMPEPAAEIPMPPITDADVMGETDEDEDM